MKKMHPAYQVVAAYFSAWSLPQAVAILAAAVKATTSQKIYRGRSPAELVYFMDKTTALLLAAYPLVKEKRQASEYVLSKAAAAGYWSLTEYSLYCGWHRDNTPWDFFPRHLSKKEFMDPRKAFRKLTTYQSAGQWKETIKDILQYALSPHPFHEFNADMNMLKIVDLLYKLLEAAHLIELRAIKPMQKNNPRN